MARLEKLIVVPVHEDPDWCPRSPEKLVKTVKKRLEASPPRRSIEEALRRCEEAEQKRKKLLCSAIQQARSHNKRARETAKNVKAKRNAEMEHKRVEIEEKLVKAAERRLNWSKTSPIAQPSAPKPFEEANIPAVSLPEPLSEAEQLPEQRLRLQLRSASQSVAELSLWMKLSATVSLVRIFLASHVDDPTDKDARRFLALVYMSNDPATFFDGSPEDCVMKREAMRFNKMLKMQLKRGAEHADSSETFGASYTRASRFYAAWSAHDVPKQAREVDEVLSRLHEQLMTVRTEQARSGAEPAPPVEILSQIRLLGGEEMEASARATFSQPWQTVGAQDLEARVREIALRAMRDALKEQVAAGEYSGLYGLLEELQKAMLALVAHSERSRDDLIDHFDPKFIEQQATHGALDTEDVAALMRYLAANIVSYQAAADEAEAQAWAREVEASLERSSGMPLQAFISAHLLDFVHVAIERVQKVYLRVRQLAEAMQNERDNPSGPTSLGEALA